MQLLDDCERIVLLVTEIDAVNREMRQWTIMERNDMSIYIQLLGKYIGHFPYNEGLHTPNMQKSYTTSAQE